MSRPTRAASRRRPRPGRRRRRDGSGRFIRVGRHRHAHGAAARGTGNLLARNLGVPLDTDAALRLALHGHARAIDVVRCETDNPDDDDILTQRFVVMAGIGLDAQIMENTSDDLKKVIRSGAYALAAVQNAAPNPFTATVTLDDGETIEQQVVMALLGNVGTITAGVPLFPQASPSDGKVDLMLASPDRVVDWARLGAQILTGRDQEGFTTMRASRLRITTDRPVPFEIDGDIAGTTRSLAVEIEPGALFVIARALIIPDGPLAEIGRTPRRDRSASASRSVALRAEIGRTDAGDGLRPTQPPPASAERRLRSTDSSSPANSAGPANSARNSSRAARPAGDRLARSSASRRRAASAPNASRRRPSAVISMMCALRSVLLRVLRTAPSRTS